VPQDFKERTNLVEKRRHLLGVAWKAVKKEDPSTSSPLPRDLRLDQGYQGGAGDQVLLGEILAGEGRESAVGTKFTQIVADGEVVKVCVGELGVLRESAEERAFACGRAAWIEG